MTTNFQQENFLIIPEFISRMQKELVSNAETKGDWRDWQPGQELLNSEIVHHLNKLNKAVQEGNREKAAEYAADVACYAMKYFERFGTEPNPSIK